MTTPGTVAKVLSELVTSMIAPLEGAILLIVSVPNTAVVDPPFTDVGLIVKLES